MLLPYLNSSPLQKDRYRLRSKIERENPMKYFLIALALILGALLSAQAAFSTETRDVLLNAKVFDQLDANVLDTSVTNLNGSAGALVEVVASLANSASFCKVWDSTGKFIGVYEGATFRFMIVPGMDQTIRCPLASGSAIKLRSMETTGVTAGKIVVQFLR
jgi:hypothetical protein